MRARAVSRITRTPLRRLAGLAAFVAMTACAPAPAPPVVNAAPGKVVRVHGTVDDTLTIRVTTQYVSEIEDCRRNPEDDAAPRSYWIDSPVVRSEGGYETTVAIDHFEAGDCGWYPFVIAFQVTNQDGLSTGHFTTGTAGTKHVPEAEGKVWISAPGGSRSANDAAPRQGSSFIRPLELQCTENVIRGVSGLSCVPHSPRELPLISEQATEVRVDFRDLTKPRQAG